MKEGREQIEGKTNGRKEGRKAGGAVRESEGRRWRRREMKKGGEKHGESAVKKTWRPENEKRKNEK
jgi:hypothetical protein